jgi:hypothetical protein
MNTSGKMLAIILLLLNCSCAVQRPVPGQQGNVSFQVFYDQLSPYGQWVNDSDYGYVWIPDAGPDFSPYSTAGHWVMTDYGWTWVSDYDWGWAPFHYGRWDYGNNYGWFWVPDNEWGPSWVTWRSGNGYYGWTPMRPGISVSMSFGGEYNNMDRWNFVRDRDFDRPDLGRYYVNRRDNDMIIRNSTVINNTYIDNSRNVTYITGPHGNDIQQATGRRISNVSIRDNDRPGQRLNNNQLQLYRPKVERINDTKQKPAPSRVSDVKDVRPAAERNINSRRNNVQQAQPQPQPQPQPQQQMQRRSQDQQKQQQTETRRQDQQQQQQQKQKQTETRSQDQQQQKQKEVTTPARTRRMERKLNKTNSEKNIRNRDQSIR